MGMGIPIPMGLGWEWEYDFPLWGSTYGYPHGDSHRNPVGMGWEWEWKFPSHGNPEIYYTTQLLITELHLKRNKIEVLGNSLNIFCN